MVFDVVSIDSDWYNYLNKTFPVGTTLSDAALALLADIGCRAFHLSHPELIFGMLLTESSGKPNATGAEVPTYGRAKGIMQVMKHVVGDYNAAFSCSFSHDDAYNPILGVLFGCYWFDAAFRQPRYKAAYWDGAIQAYYVGLDGFRRGRRAPDYLSKVKSFSKRYKPSPFINNPYPARTKTVPANIEKTDTVHLLNYDRDFPIGFKLSASELCGLSRWASGKYGVPANVLFGVLWHESAGGLAHQLGSCGEHGIGQIMKETFNEFKKKLGRNWRFDVEGWYPTVSAQLASYILSYHYALVKDWDTACLCYTYGLTGALSENFVDYKNYLPRVTGYQSLYKVVPYSWDKG